MRKVWGEVDSAWTDEFWNRVTRDRITFLRLKVAPLLRYVPDVDVAAETFSCKVERLNLQILQGKPSPELLQSIAEDVSLLPPHVLEAATRQPSVRLALSEDLAQATPPQLKQLITDLAGEMRVKRLRESAFLTIDLPDFITAKGYVLIDSTDQPVHVEEYRRRVERCILDIAETHPALVAIREGCQPTADQLVDLERVLHTGLTGSDIKLSDKAARQAYGLKLDNRLGFLGFVRHVLDLDAMPDYETVVAGSFQDHIARHNYTGDQIRFLRAVQDVFLAKRHLAEADLYEAPLTNFGRNAVERFFSPAEIKDIMALTEHLVA